MLDPVKLSKTDTGFVVPDILAPRVPCKDHDFNSMKPLVLATWKHGSQGQMPGKSSILVESQSVLGKIYLNFGLWFWPLILVYSFGHLEKWLTRSNARIAILLPKLF